MVAARASLKFGKSQSSNGRTTVDVLSDENWLVEANQMNTNQKMSGP
jgi:hypothetical protein